MAKILGDAYGFANVKSRANRQSVPAIITSAQQRLKLYNKVPANGLILYTGTIISDEGKEKMVAIDFEAFKPISASLCVCDNKFRTKALNNLLESDDKFGFIVMDENGTLLGTLSGNTRKVLCEFTAILRRAAEFATQFFINATTSQLNVSGLILASPADFIAELSQSDMFDPRLQVKILNIVNVPYGGENGFDQAIELSSDILSNVKFVQQKRLIRKYFEEISQDTGKYVFGVEDTLKALELGAVQTLIVWENLEINRYVLKSAATGEISVKYLDKGQEGDQSHFRERGGSELEVQEKISLLEWFANECRKFGCAVEFVANNSR